LGLERQGARSVHAVERPLQEGQECMRLERVRLGPEPVRPQESEVEQRRLRKFAAGIADSVLRFPTSRELARELPAARAAQGSGMSNRFVNALCSVSCTSGPTNTRLPMNAPVAFTPAWSQTVPFGA